MNLYLLTQTKNLGYDTFNACVVAALDTDEARTIHPRGDREYVKGWGWRVAIPSWMDRPSRPDQPFDDAGWTRPENVSVTMIGVATESVKSGVVLASFTAG